MVDVAERAPEIAGFAAVVSVLVPWSVSLSATGFSESVALRFVFGSLELAFGARSGDVTPSVLSVTELGSRYSGDLARVATFWLVAAALAAVAVVFALALFAAGERLAVGPFDPVRAMGGLCLLIALSLSGATWLLYQHTPQTPIPVGLLALYLFAAGLFTVDRSGVGRSAAETSG